jgi:serine/threonine-protein kinase SRPK3
MIALLGPPPPSVLARAALRSKFYSDTGKLRLVCIPRLPSDKPVADEWCAGIPLPDPRPLEKRLTVLEGEDKDLFLRLMRKMLQWEPEKRSTAAELAQDEWIHKHTVNERF